MAQNEKVTLETEIHTVFSAVQDIDAGARPHSFKSTNFMSPTTCGFCQKSIWGLAGGGKGFICTGIPHLHDQTNGEECGYTCHAKCQMKAPQDCTGVSLKADAKKAKKKKKGGKDGADNDDDPVTGNGSLRRTSTDSSIPSIATPTSPRPTSVQQTSSVSVGGKPTATRHIANAPPPAKYINTPIALAPNGGATGSTAAKKAKVLYKYDATSAEELSVKSGDVINILEPDDGSGWIVAKIGRDEGLVPAAYVEVQSAEPASAAKKGPPVAPRRSGKKPEEPKKKKTFRAIYDYDANSELEISIREGDLLALVGEDKGDGWTEVEMKGNVGSVPSNYIEPLDR